MSSTQRLIHKLMNLSELMNGSAFDLPPCMKGECNHFTFEDPEGEKSASIQHSMWATARKSWPSSCSRIMQRDQIEEIARVNHDRRILAHQVLTRVMSPPTRARVGAKDRAQRLGQVSKTVNTPIDCNTSFQRHLKKHVGSGQVNTLDSRKKRLRFGKSSIHSWGVFADEPFFAGDFVIEYK